MRNSLLSIAIGVVSTIGIVGCSGDDVVSPQSGTGTVEVISPSNPQSAIWYLYGPNNSFQRGTGSVVLDSMPSGEYTIIWNGVDNWTGPLPTTRILNVGSGVLFEGVYLDKAPADEVVLISDGTFLMGSPGPNDTDFSEELGRNDDEGLHWVTLTRDFYLGITEVTNQHYLELAQWAVDNGHAAIEGDYLIDALDGSSAILLEFNIEDTQIESSDGILRLKRPEYALRPVVEVTWYGAISYCDWLSLRNDYPRAYDHRTGICNGGDLYGAVGFRLPSEAEWEYSCRAGTQTAFCDGDLSDPDYNPSDVAWYRDNSQNRSHEVGGKSPNSFGLYDMHGNVWEWCNDFYGLYGEGSIENPLVDPMGPSDSNFKVVRGGRFLLDKVFCRSASRLLWPADYIGNNVGFRVSRSSVEGQ